MINETINGTFLMIDIVAVVIIAISLIAVFFVNHFYLQFLLSINFIFFGIATAIIIFLQAPFENLILKGIETYSSNIKLIISIFIENKLIEFLTFYLIFFILLNTIIVNPIYFFLIKRKYNTFFGINLWKKNLWKVIFIPINTIIISFFFLALMPFVNKTNQEKSFFFNFLKIVKINELSSNVENNYKDFSILNSAFEFNEKFKDASIEYNEKKAIFLRIKNEEENKIIWSILNDKTLNADANVISNINSLNNDEALSEEQYKNLFENYSQLFDGIFEQFFGIQT